MAQRPFFVGYLPVPAGLRRFLALTSVTIIALMASAAWLIGTTQDDPGDGRAFGRQTVTGVVSLAPYPMLHVTEGDRRIPAGETILLSGVGKFGVQPRATMEGAVATASGVLLMRGDLGMLQLRNGRSGLVRREGEETPPPDEPLGRWRLAGEICDGKCAAGAMRPGRGIAHKACANLCITGGVPPVFVTTAPVEGEEFLLIGSAGDDPIGAATLDLVGRYISVEGRVIRRGGLLVFLIEPDTAEGL